MAFDIDKDVLKATITCINPDSGRDGIFELTVGKEYKFECTVTAPEDDLAFTRDLKFKWYTYEMPEYKQDHDDDDGYGYITYKYALGRDMICCKCYKDDREIRLDYDVKYVNVSSDECLMKFKAIDDSGYVLINNEQVALKDMTLKDGVYSYEYKISCSVHDSAISFSNCKVTDVDRIDIPYAYSVAGAFKNCTKLKQVANITTVGVKDMRQMFQGCTNLMTIPLGMLVDPDKADSNLDNVSYMDQMFEGCINMEGGASPINYWENSKRKSYSDCFKGCIALKNYHDIPESWGGTEIPTKITLIKGIKEVYVGDTVQLRYYFNVNNHDYKVTWSSDNTDVLTVDDRGEVTGISKGKATVTVRYGNLSDSVEITVIPVLEPEKSYPYTDISLSLSYNKDRIKVSWLPKVNPRPTIQWSYDPEGIITVDEVGNITYLKYGTVKVTGTVVDSDGVGDLSDTITVVSDINSIIIKGEDDLGVKMDYQLDFIWSPYTLDKPTNVKWSSSDTTVATVDGNGLLTTKAVGNVTITCKYNDNVYDKLFISVLPLLRSIEITGRDTVDKYKQIQLSYTWKDIRAPKPTVTWISENPNIATIDENGLVTGITPGNAVIICKYNEDIWDRKVITVLPALTSIKVHGQREVDKYQSITMDITWEEPDHDEPDVVWVSSDTHVAIVNQLGLVTGVGAGDTTIKCIYDANIHDELPITVNPVIERITITGNIYSIDKGKTTQLGYTWEDKRLPRPTVTWESSDPNIATIDGTGLLTAKEKGTVTIKCTYRDTKTGRVVYDKITMVVNPILESITIVPVEPSNPGGGSGGGSQGGSGGSGGGSGSGSGGGSEPEPPSVDVGGNTGFTIQTNDPAVPAPPVTWESSDPNIAIVDNNGVVTGKGNGVVTIYCKYQGKIWHQILVKVFAKLKFKANWLENAFVKINDIDVKLSNMQYLNGTYIHKYVDDILKLSFGGFDELENTIKKYCDITELITVDTSKIVDMEGMFRGCDNLKKVGSLNTAMATNMKGMFENCKNLIEVAKMNTNKVVDMSNMFKGCECLKKIPELDTSKVTNMTQMFKNCKAIDDIVEAKKYWAKNVKNLRANEAFKNCTKLNNYWQIPESWGGPKAPTNITVQGPSEVEAGGSIKLSYTFNVPDFNFPVKWTSSNPAAASVDENGNVKANNITAGVTITCSYGNGVSIDFKLDVYQLLSFRATNENGKGYIMVNGRKIMLTDIPKVNGVYNYRLNNNVTSVKFADGNQPAEYSKTCNLLELIKLDCNKIIDTAFMFAGCNNLTSIPKIDTSKVTDMSYMFSGCEALKQIPNLNMSNVTNTKYMFNKCTGMEGNAIPEKFWDNNNVSSFYNCFAKCDSLKNSNDIPFNWK